MTFQKRGRYERLDAAIPIEVHFLTPSPTTHTVMCDNIGGKGFRFSHERKLEVNTPLELTIHLPDSPSPLHSKGRVTWVREAKQAPDSPKVLYEMGVAFLGLTFQEKDRIQQYIYRRMRP